MFYTNLLLKCNLTFTRSEKDENYFCTLCEAVEKGTGRPQVPAAIHIFAEDEIIVRDRKEKICEPVYDHVAVKYDHVAVKILKK